MFEDNRKYLLFYYDSPKIMFLIEYFVACYLKKRSRPLWNKLFRQINYGLPNKCYGICEAFLHGTPSLCWSLHTCGTCHENSKNHYNSLQYSSASKS